MAGSRKDHDGFRLCIQNTATFQGGRVTRQVLFDTGEDWNQIWVQAIDLVLALPFPEDESAVQQAAEIMGDTTLLEPKLLTDLADMMWSALEQLYDRKPRLVRQRPKELPIEFIAQYPPLGVMIYFRYDKFHIS